MTVSSFDNLPQLSKEEALEILSKPLDQLSLTSDYYKAVFHLSKYPGKDTEEALLKLLKTTGEEQALVIARRKAVEALASLGCSDAIPSIGLCLVQFELILVIEELFQIFFR